MPGDSVKVGARPVHNHAARGARGGMCEQRVLLVSQAHDVDLWGGAMPRPASAPIPPQEAAPFCALLHGCLGAVLGTCAPSPARCGASGFRKRSPAAWYMRAVNNAVKYREHKAAALPPLARRYEVYGRTAAWWGVPVSPTVMEEHIL